MVFKQNLRTWETKNVSLIIKIKFAPAVYLNECLKHIKQLISFFTFAHRSLSYHEVPWQPLGYSSVRTLWTHNLSKSGKNMQDFCDTAWNDGWYRGTCSKRLHRICCADVVGYLGYLIWLRHLFRSKSVSNLKIKLV